MQAAADNPNMMGYQHPPPPPTYGQGYQGYAQDFSFQHMPNAYNGYNQMSNAHFMYHNEGGNMGYTAPDPQSPVPSQPPNLPPHCGNEE
jgi:hypothetical protein